MDFQFFVGNTQNADFLEHQARNDHCPRKIGKMEIWLREQEARGELLWDSSSSESDELGKVERDETSQMIRDHMRKGLV